MHSSLAPLCAYVLSGQALRGGWATFFLLFSSLATGVRLGKWVTNSYANANALMLEALVS